jgi:EAL domain-containing protein (putative c-di-GMP-specific phosphodiesterase class I)
MNVIAEGLETEEEKHFLKDLGCSSYQGYLLSPPLPLPLFENLFQQQAIFTTPADTPT